MRRSEPFKNVVYRFGWRASLSIEAEVHVNVPQLVAELMKSMPQGAELVSAKLYQIRLPGGSMDASEEEETEENGE